MPRRTRLLMLAGILAATLLVAIGLLRLTPNWFQRGPAASPTPSGTAEPAAPPPSLQATVPFGMQALDPRVEDGVKTYDFTLQKVRWDTGGGNWKEAYTVNGMVPGPLLRVNEGERIRVHVTNQLDEASSIHWHGMILPPEQDGVAHLTQQPIEPGQSFTYEFSPGPPGTHWYHSHFDGAKQVPAGLFGPLLVVPMDPKHPAHPSNFDREHVIMIGDAGLGLTLNGKSFPYNLPMKVKTGERVLIRLINAGVGNHPMHLHGHDFRIVAKDSNPIAQPMVWNTIDIAPGETYDAALTASNPGSWLFHCHILPHAEGPNGMFGLTNLFEYEGYEPDPNNPMANHVPTPNRLPGTPGQKQ